MSRAEIDHNEWSGGERNHHNDERCGPRYTDNSIWPSSDAASEAIPYFHYVEPVQLSAKPELPAGTVMSVDIYKVPKSEKLWSDPDTFDPMRFLKLR